MVKYYDVKKDEKERHENELKAADEVAKEAEMVALERDWPYEKAAAYVLKKNPKTAEMYSKGYLSEEPAKSYTMTSLEAGEQLADLTKKKMRREKLTFEIAQAKVFKENPELVETYAKGD
jgi:hypothetical protein